LRRVQAADATRSRPLPANLATRTAAAVIDGVDSTAKAEGTTPAVRNRPAAFLTWADSQDKTPTLPVASTQRWNRSMAHRMAERGSDSALSKAR